jgi:hypothetical protein
MDSKAVARPLGTWSIAVILAILPAVQSQGNVGKAAEEEATPARASAPYALRFVKGQSYDIRLGTRQEKVEKEAESESGQRQPAFDSQPYLVNTTFYYRFNVRSVDEAGNAWADCTVKRVKIQQKLGFVPDVDYDSAKAGKRGIPKVRGIDDVAYAYARCMSAFLDAQFALRVTPYGHVQDVKGAESVLKHVWKKLGAQPPEKPDEAQTAGVKQEIRTFLWAHPFADCSQSPLGLADSWTGTEKTSDGVEWQTRGTVKERKADVATIEIVGQATKKDPAGPGRWHRSVEINEATGEVLSSVTRWEQPGMAAVGSFEMTKAKD